MTFERDGLTFNLLDTPGHQDFSEDTYRTLTAVDSAIMVIDAAKGIESQTRKLFEVCRLRDIPIITFITKIDREGPAGFGRGRGGGSGEVGRHGRQNGNPLSLKSVGEPINGVAETQRRGEERDPCSPASPGSRDPSGKCPPAPDRGGKLATAPALV
jgi:hypothetical protein